jgi:1-phosphofructokinase family hexose kinase
MILVVTPNPALDKTVVVPHFRAGQTARVSDVRQQAGGKGFNVARALRTFGEAVAVAAPLGGHIGALVRDLAVADGIPCREYAIASETRTCLTVVDSAEQQISEVYEAGPTIDGATWRQFSERVVASLEGVAMLAVAGSLMPGAPAESLHDLILRARAAGLPTMLDTYGAALTAALHARPALVKINHVEAAGLLGQAITTFDELIVAAHAIQHLGAGSVVITFGRQGAGGVGADGCFFGWAAPVVASRSPIGSGDAFFGALLTALRRGQPLAEAARWGVAAGAANTLQLGAATFSLGQFEQLLPETTPALGL